MPSYFITGANRGIGFAFTEALLEDPKNVVVAGARDPSAAQALNELIVRHPGRLSIIPFDLMNPALIDKAAELTSAILPDGLDYLVNNAGDILEPLTPFESINVDLVEKNIRVNAVAPILVVRTFLPLLRKGHEKKVVFLSSVLGVVGLAEEFLDLAIGYSMSKAALNIMVCKWAPALKAEGITTIVLHPGYVSTALTIAAAPWMESHVPHMKLISKEESARGCLKVIRDVTVADDVGMWSNEGQQIPW